MEIRPLTKPDMEQARLLWEECFDDDPTFLDWYFQSRFQPPEGLGLFTDRVLLSDLHLAPRTIKIRKHTYPSAYLIALATAPAARRQGLAKKLLSFALRHLAANQIFFTFLMPFNVEFYTRLGWGVCCHHQIYTLPPAAGEHLPEAESSNHPPALFRFQQAEPDGQVLAKIYERWAEQFDSSLLRTENDWECLLRDHHTDNGKVWLGFNQQAEVLGYALTLISPTAEPHLQIRELAYTDQTIRDPFLARLSEVGTGLTPAHPKERLLLWTAPETENSNILTPAAKRPVILGRITNVEQALTALTYPAITQLCSLEVFDPLLPENNGHYTLRLTAGRMQVLKSQEKSAEVRCSIDTLIRLLMGTVHPPEAVLKGELELATPELLPFLTTIFPKTTTYINEYF